MPPWSCTQSCSSTEPYSPDVRHRHARQLPASARRLGDRRRRRVGDGVARFQPRLHVGEAMLQRLVRRERAAEGVAVERPLDRHVERALHRADAFGREDHARVLQLPFDVRSRWRRPHRRPRPVGTRTSSKRTSEKRRVRSTDFMGVNVTPGASVGTSTCERPSPVRPVTRRWRARRGRLHRRLDAVQHDVAASDADLELDPPEPAVRCRLGVRPGRDRVAGDQRARPADERDRAGTAAAATTLAGRSGPGAAWAPNSYATTLRSTTPCPLIDPPPASSGTSSDVHPRSAPRFQ